MTIQEKIEAYTPEAIAFRREIHRHPELSTKEVNTTARIRSILKSLGIGIRDAGLETGLIAEIHGTAEGSGKIAAVRADIDALPIMEATGLPFASETPGVCHACGHDVHTAALLLAARILQEDRANFSGTVRLMFQPAEETGTGAKTLIAHGALEPKPDRVIGIHTWPFLPGGTIGIRRGCSHASSDTLTIRVTGKGGHGAYPYRCIDPVVTAAALILQLQTIVSRELSMNDGAVLTIGQINAGTAPNVIPDEVVMHGTLRTYDPQRRKEIIESIIRISESCAAAMRATASVSFSEHSMPVLMNDIAVADEIIAASEKVLGPGRTELLPVPSCGSDDFAFYLNAGVSGALFRIGTTNDDPASTVGLHNAGNIFDEKSIPTAAAVLVQYLEDYLK